MTTNGEMRERLVIQIATEAHEQTEIRDRIEQYVRFFHAQLECRRGVGRVTIEGSAMQLDEFRKGLEAATKCTASLVSDTLTLAPLPPSSPSETPPV